MSAKTSQIEKGAAFAAMHRGEPFVIPNPWDAGSARVLEALGFEALATTSSGFAFTLGRHDGTTTLGEVAAHVRVLVEATQLPISVDLENGYGPTPEDAAAAIARVADAGAVGGSIEDWDPSGRFYTLDKAAERIAAAHEATERLDFRFTLTARAESHFRGNADLDDTIARLQAYERAGADVLYAPMLKTLAEIRSVCQAVSKPVNVLAVADLSVDEIVSAGAQRISIGGRFTWVAVQALVTAANQIREHGSFAAIDVTRPPDAWLNH